MKPVKLRLGDSYWFELTVDDYTLFGSQVGLSSNDQCTLCFIESDSFWVLGMPFLNNLY